jgi:hypothetical protein
MLCAPQLNTDDEEPTADDGEVEVSLVEIEITVPLGIVPGTMFKARGPNNEPLEVPLPMNAQPGMKITVTVPVRTRKHKPLIAKIERGFPTFVKRARNIGLFSAFVNEAESTGTQQGGDQVAPASERAVPRDGAGDADADVLLDREVPVTTTKNESGKQEDLQAVKPFFEPPAMLRL